MKRLIWSTMLGLTLVAAVGCHSSDSRHGSCACSHTGASACSCGHCKGSADSCTCAK